jgi:hypothetical protein
MIAKLKSYANPPPGLFAFTQTTGIVHQFRNNPTIEYLAKEVSAFRLKNNLPRAALCECLSDIDAFNCFRLGNHPDWCFVNEVSFESSRSEHPFIKKHCPTCGTPTTN